MSDSLDPVPDFKRGRYLGLIAFVVAMLLGVGVVLALSGVFKEKRGRPIEIVEEESEDNKEGGCPCQCDRSQAMAAELRGLEGPDALRAIEQSLHTIAEREEAGYVTEAMISHRLRLVDMEAELRGAGTIPAALSTRSVSSDFDHRAGREHRTIADGTLRAAIELIVHGQTTEWVNGREKPLRPCFLLSLELKNATDAVKIVKQPEIASQVPFPISRWYVKGEGGQPWNGRLAARERKTIHVIGYVGSELAPKTKVAAAIRFESSTFHATTLARSRWNRVEPSSVSP